MTKNRSLLLVTGLILAAGLSACSRSEPEASQDNVAIEAPEETPTPVATPTPEPMPMPTLTNAVDSNATAEAEPPTPPDEQMLDDASATGMTARASRGDPGTEETPVAADEERK